MSIQGCIRLALVAAALAIPACTFPVTLPPIASGLLGNAADVVASPPVATPGSQPSSSPTPSTNALGIKEVKSVAIAPQSFVIVKGTQKDVIATVTYVDGSKDSNVSWSSSDDSILTVNPTNGKITAVKQGNASVVAVSNNNGNKKAVADVSVKPAEATEAFAMVAPAELTIEVEEVAILNGEIKLSDGTVSPNLTWSSSDEAVALVSGAGGEAKVTGLKPGKATILARAGGKSAQAKITVKAKTI